MINFLEVIMPLIYYYYTVYSKLYKYDRVNRFLNYMYVHREFLSLKCFKKQQSTDCD